MNGELSLMIPYWFHMLDAARDVAGQKDQETESRLADIEERMETMPGYYESLAAQYDAGFLEESLKAMEVWGKSNKYGIVLPTIDEIMAELDKVLLL